MINTLKIILDKFGGKGYLIIKEIPFNNKKVEIEVIDIENKEKIIIPSTQVKKEWYKVESARKKILADVGIIDKKQIIQLVKYIEEKYKIIEKEKEKKKEHEKQEKEKIDKEINEKSMELLRNPNLFYQLGKDMEQGVFLDRYNEVRWILEEEDIKRLVPFLAFTGRRKDKGAKQIGIQLQSEGSSTSKDTLEFITTLLFNIKVEEMGSVTNGYMKRGLGESISDIYYYPEDYSNDYNETTRIKRQTRPGDAGLTSKYMEEVSDESGGKSFVKRTSYTPAKTFISTTNAEKIDRANAATTIRLKMNETSELTRKVIDKEFEINKQEPITNEKIKIWQRASDIINNLEIKDEDIKIPYSPNLSLLVSDKISDTRRLPKIIKQYIRTIALWRWYQKPENKRDEADIIDLYIALRLGKQLFLQTSEITDKNEKKVLDSLKKLMKEEISERFSIRQIAKEIGLSEPTTNQSCGNLYKKGLILREKIGKPFYYYVDIEDILKTNDANLIIPYYIRNPTANDIKEAISKLDSNLFAYSEKGNIYYYLILFIDPINGKKVQYILNEKDNKDIDILHILQIIKNINIPNSRISK